MKPLDASKVKGRFRWFAEVACESSNLGTSEPRNFGTSLNGFRIENQRRNQLGDRRMDRHRPLQRSAVAPAFISR